MRGWIKNSLVVPFGINSFMFYNIVLYYICIYVCNMYAVLDIFAYYIIIKIYSHLTYGETA